MSQQFEQNNSHFGTLFSEMLSLALYFEVIGVAYSIAFFAGFDLNYADYANIDDLILGSFKEPIVFVAGFSTIIYLNFKRKSQKKSSKLSGILLLTIPIIIASCIGIAASYYVRDPNRNIPFSNTGKWFEITLIEELEKFHSDRKIHSAKLIGVSGDYMFFYDIYKDENSPCSRSTIILPKRTILEMARKTDPPQRKCD